MSNPRFLRSYADDPTLGDRIFDLLETWFTGIGKRRRVAAQIGSLWERCSTPFVCERLGRILSHVGLLEMPYVIKGERHQLGGVHAVCTLESERSQGHYGRIMEELLEYCEGRFEALELGTEHPEYYEPFGFRVVPEHRFVARVTRVGCGGFRPIDAMRKSDVVARELPSIDALVSQLSRPVEEVEFRFSPDRFEVDGRPEPFRSDGDYYMVRGPFPAEDEAFMVPPPARH
jgi:predicted N-acetyltransferase YhbS